MLNDLASIKRISEIKIHPNADALELAIIEGWQCVVKKGEFKAGDLVIYVAIDTKIEGEPPWAEFLRPKNFRIRAICLRGELSFGLILPLSILSTPKIFEGEEDCPVHDLIGVVKYEKPEGGGSCGPRPKAKSNTFPSFTGMSVTDETNLQSKKKLLDVFKGKPYYITVKQDGSSFSCTYGVTPANPETPEFILASRKRWISYQEESETEREFALLDGTTRTIVEKQDLWSKAAMKYNLPEVMKWHSRWGFQAELLGPSIQKNRLGLKDVELRVFNLYDKVKGHYVGLKDLKWFCQETELPMAEILEEGDNFNYSLEDLLDKAINCKYANGHPAEGIVLRPQESEFCSTVGGMLSCKILNSEYLLKYEE